MDPLEIKSPLINIKNNKDLIILKLTSNISTLKMCNRRTFMEKAQKIFKNKETMDNIKEQSMAITIMENKTIIL